MADIDSERSDREVGRRGPDVLTLIFGIGTLLVSAFVLTDGALWIPSLDPRWLVAGGALVVGLFLLTASLRGGRKRR